MLAMRCDLTPGVLVRALGHSVTGAHRLHCYNRSAGIFDRILTPQHRDHLQRVLELGAPHRLRESSSAANRAAFVNAGNHGSAKKNASVVEECINKDERQLHALALPIWCTNFTPNIHLSPLAVLIKNKKARLLFDGSFRPGVDYFSINDVTDMTDEWIISYGVAMAAYLAWIWNLRISHPGKPIFQYFDDVANAFRHIALHPDVVGAHASRTPATDLLIMALAAVFGKVDSPAEYMICADARAALAEFLQTPLGRTLLDSVYSFEKDIPWAPSAPSTPFAAAEADILNPGVIVVVDGKLQRRKAPHHPFVDDTCLAELRENLPEAIHASIQALFMTLGYPKDERVDILNIEKFQRVQCGEVQVQLGIEVDTRNMEVRLPTNKVERIVMLLDSVWASHRKYFTPLDGAQLLGLLRHATLVAWWGKYSFVELQGMMNDAIRRECYRQANGDEDIMKLYYKPWRAVLREAHNARHDDWLMGNAPMGFKLYWNRMERVFITPDLHVELNFLRLLFSEDHRARWSSPIAQSVKRNHHFLLYTDASLEGLGAACQALGFLIRISVPPYLVKETVKYKPKAPLITINDLELAAVVIAYAGVRTAVFQGRHNQCSQWPVLLCKLDNVVAKANITKGTAKSLRARALLKIFASIARYSDVGLSAEFIPGKLNVMADFLSRNVQEFEQHSNETFRSFFAKYPQMDSSAHFLPSHRLLSQIWQALQTGTVTDLQLLKIQGLSSRDTDILGTFAPITT